MDALLLAVALAAAPESPLTTPRVAPHAVASAGASTVLPGLVLLALAILALVVSRRKRAAPASRVMDIIETTPLGPRRSLVVARVGQDALVLAVSESGIALLATRPAGDLAPSSAAPAPAPAPSFEQALRSAGGSDAEDELRRKLQQGAGRLR